MARTAEYTIQGFIYQFLITLSKLLETDEGEITVEGVVEDIDVTTAKGIEAFQCKYHETKTKFTLSSIYKPILQMLCHFQNNQSASIKYRLHAHFPNESVGTTKTLKPEELNEVMDTKAVNLQTYISQLSGFTNTPEFLKRFEIHFGSSYSDVESSIIVSLAKEGLTTDDVKEIFYPNAIHRIAEISIKHNVNERKINKVQFLSELKLKKKTAISRWTKELHTYNSLLRKRREQLRDNLNKNSRVRGLIWDAAYMNGFDDKIIQLIEDFVNKYNAKIKLSACPIFSLKCDETNINRIWKSLNAKGIGVERGKIAGEMDPAHFLRQPIKNIKENKTEFNVRICNHDEDFDKIVMKAGFDDLFVLSEKLPSCIRTLGSINIEHIETKEFNEVRYLLSLNNSL